MSRGESRVMQGRWRGIRVCWEKVVSIRITQPASGGAPDVAGTRVGGGGSPEVAGGGEVASLMELGAMRISRSVFSVSCLIGIAFWWPTQMEKAGAL
ncbi:hypothetical protein DV096_14220 [Bradymonadaceae bacterium TMQ3]|nr:hypothetical protein DV096_14220 [Bradymonadaceae bacterium TMQ3]